MATPSTGGASRAQVRTAGRAGARPPLTRQAVLRAAVTLIDQEGLESLTMRRLATDLGVEAMSLYHHVGGKEALLAGVIDLVADEVVVAVDGLTLPDPSTDWQGDLRRVILTAREVMLTHPWAPELIETRATLSLPVIAHHERVLRIMRDGGFTWDLAHHALHALGSRIMGFSQELFRPDAAGDGSGGAQAPELPPEAFPQLAGMLASVSHDPQDPSLGWCDDQTEFEFALDLMLGGLERLRAER